MKLFHAVALAGTVLGVLAAFNPARPSTTTSDGEQFVIVAIVTPADTELKPSQFTYLGNQSHPAIFHTKADCEAFRSSDPEYAQEIQKLIALAQNEYDEVSIDTKCVADPEI